MSDGRNNFSSDNDLLHAADADVLIQRACDATSEVAAGIPHSLLVIHIERFADVIKNCGDNAETALLELVRSTLHQQAGPVLCACRIAVDQFALLKARCLPRDAAALGRRLRVALEGGTFRWETRSFRLGVSVGVVELGDLRYEARHAFERAVDACNAARSLGGDGILLVEGRGEPRTLVQTEQRWRDHIREILT